MNLDKLPDLAKVLKLSRQEEYFLFLLACKNSSRNPEIRRHFENILGRLRHESVITGVAKVKPGEGDHRYLHEDLVAMALHSLARLPAFQEDIPWILRTLPIPGLEAEKVRITLELLERKGALIRDKAGKLRAKEWVFWQPDPSNPKDYGVYRKGAESAAHLLQTAEDYQPSVYMLMDLVFDEEGLKEAEKRMIALFHDLQNLSNKTEKPTATAFVSNFFITLARLRDSRTSD